MVCIASRRTCTASIGIPKLCSATEANGKSNSVVTVSKVVTKDNHWVVVCPRFITVYDFCHDHVNAVTPLLVKAF